MRGAPLLRGQPFAHHFLPQELARTHGEGYSAEIQAEEPFQPRGSPFAALLPAAFTAPGRAISGATEQVIRRKRWRIHVKVYAFPRRLLRPCQEKPVSGQGGGERFPQGGTGQDHLPGNLYELAGVTAAFRACQGGHEVEEEVPHHAAMVDGLQGGTQLRQEPREVRHQPTVAPGKEGQHPRCFHG